MSLRTVGARGTTTEEQEMITNEHLLQAFAAAGADGGIIYLSTSITSGYRLFKLSELLDIPPDRLQSEAPQAWRDQVFEPNIEEARNNARTLRAKNQNKIVIDPSAIEVKGWLQFDYNSFWVELLSTFPTNLVVAPNWEYSKGSRYEVAFALRKGIPISGMDESDITEKDAELASELAVRYLSGLGLSDEQVQALLPPLTDPQVQSMSAASQCFDWLIHEREYQVEKFGTDLDDEHTLAGLGEESWWWQQLTNYFHRSRVLGLDTPVGRQAIAKFAATSCGLLESVIRVYGALPRPGVSSGEIEW
jgi:hypothetical protein